ncbi:thioredoxin 1 [Thermovibrio guaymasensis]|uniref:Thioredoxin 1 n=1 Tax=Thermovibrio guaymasensis TaxID=240167 RepID=A0A420W6H4_9BACT|nr:thioredoxin family protein [Thermovibrio guaymasensis]RKQ61702.1 thioredoxin 1 [Thermovibrio guaymasensis]
MSIPEPLLKVAAIFFDVIFVLLVFSFIFIFGLRFYWRWKAKRLKGEPVPEELLVPKLKKGKGLIYFYSPNCRPCQMVEPIYKKLSKELKGVHFVKINVLEKPEAVRKIGILATPSMVLVKDGRIKEVILGPVSEGVLREKLK